MTYSENNDQGITSRSVVPTRLHAFVGTLMAHQAKRRGLYICDPPL